MGPFFFELAGRWPIAISEAGGQVAVGIDLDTIVGVGVGTKMEEFRLTRRITSHSAIAISPDRRWLAVGNTDHTIKVWDLWSGMPRLTLKGHTGIVMQVWFSPDSSRLISSDNRTVRQWDVKTGNALERPLSPRSGMLSGDGRWVSVVEQKVTKVYDTTTGKQEHILALAVVPGMGKVAVSREGTRVASYSPFGNTITVWDSKGPTLLHHEPGTRYYTHHPNDLVFSPDGRWFAWATFRGGVGVLEVDKKRVARYRLKSGAPINAMAFSEQGDRLAAASDDRQVAVWDLRSDEDRPLLLPGHTGAVHAVAFEKDGTRLWSGGADGTVRCWDLKDARMLVTLVPQREGDDWLTLTPDGFFDGTRAGWRLVPFRFPSQPLRIYAPEQFFNLFFQPGLLADVVRTGLPMREILRAGKDPRAELDVSSYRNSNLPEVRFVFPEAGPKASDREVVVEASLRDTGSGAHGISGSSATNRWSASSAATSPGGRSQGACPAGSRWPVEPTRSARIASTGTTSRAEMPSSPWTGRRRHRPARSISFRLGSTNTRTRNST